MCKIFLTVEAFQILNLIKNYDRSKKWANHPAVLMWLGYEECLKLYLNVFIEEWISRNYKNNMVSYEIDLDKVIYPWWFNNDNYHRSHRARLIDKKYDFYYNKWPDDYKFNNGLYFWPVNETKTFKIIISK